MNVGATLRRVAHRVDIRQARGRSEILHCLSLFLCVCVCVLLQFPVFLHIFLLVNCT